MEGKVSLNGLRQCLKGYNEGLRNHHCGYEYGDWSIGDGAYDINWVLKYKGEECIHALESDDYNMEIIENQTLSLEDFMRVYYTIANTYGSSEKIGVGTIFQNPEICRLVDLSQVFTENDKYIWERENHISIEDNRVLQEVIKKLQRMHVTLEHFIESPTTYYLRVPSHSEIGQVSFELKTDGSIRSIERSLSDLYHNFKADDFVSDYILRSHLNSDELIDSANKIKQSLKKVYNKTHDIIRSFELGFNL